MQHRPLKYEDAVDLIGQLDAVEIHAHGDTQVFTANRSGLPAYIILTGTDALLIEHRPKLQAVRPT